MHEDDQLQHTRRTSMLAATYRYAFQSLLANIYAVGVVGSGTSAPGEAETYQVLPGSGAMWLQIGGVPRGRLLCAHISNSRISRPRDTPGSRTNCTAQQACASHSPAERQPRWRHVPKC